MTFGPFAEEGVESARIPAIQRPFQWPYSPFLAGIANLADSDARSRKRAFFFRPGTRRTVISVWTPERSDWASNAVLETRPNRSRFRPD
jgi:hypothetical protein